ncbi:MAG: dimethylarginine dimethylaminohydrolase family protein [Planctomycetota bacterium]
MTSIVSDLADWRRLPLAHYARPAAATGVLVCPPTHFDVVDVQNIHMVGRVAQVDRSRAEIEWRQLCDAFRGVGLRVEELEPEAGLVDLVFTANPSLHGVGRDGEPFCIEARMRHASRQPEVARHMDWARQHGLRRVRIPPHVSGCFEGGGDGVWHPGHFALWGGVGPRSDRACFEALSAELDLPVILLELVDPAFYHLDTCLATLGPGRAAAVLSAFDDSGRQLLRAAFSELIEVDEAEARERLAGNLYCPNGRDVFLPAGSPRTRARLEAHGLQVTELRTDEFLKSGGSIYCLRQELYG